METNISEKIEEIKNKQYDEEAIKEALKRTQRYLKELAGEYRNEGLSIEEIREEALKELEKGLSSVPNNGFKVYDLATKYRTVKELLKMYKKYPALYAGDNNPEGFEWINADDGDRSIFSFVRKSPTKRNNILYIVNFTPVDRPDYRVGVPKKKQYKLIMDENGLLEQPKTFKAVKQKCDNREFSFAYPLPAYGVAIFTY